MAQSGSMRPLLVVVRLPAQQSLLSRAHARPGTHHQLGQTLLITESFGWVQLEGEPVEDVRHGDIVWFEPEEKH